MHSTARLAPFVLLFAAAVAVAVVAVPQDVDEPLPPAADPTDALLADLGRRSATKRELIADLADGRRTLVDVAARFAALDADRPGHMLVVQYYPGATLGERYCRVVMGHAEAALEGDPRRRPVLARLDAELAGVVAAGRRLTDIAGAP
jgi:hypothetical protein